MKRIKYSFILITLFFFSCHSQTEFSSLLWKKIPPSRKFMTESLIQKLILEKSTKSEVKTLLGNSTEEGMKIDQGNTLIYFVQSKTLLGMRSEWLSIKFDKNRVIDASLEEID